jgi:hypothetical protein
VNLVLLDELACQLEGLAVLHRTTPGELVMDWIEEKAHGMRFSVPGLRAVKDPGGEAGEAA